MSVVCIVQSSFINDFKFNILREMLNRNMGNLKLIKWVIAPVWFFAISFFPNNGQAQDPQFSQYYAAPLYLNPALTGINQQGRAGINYRNQWPSINAGFETYSAFLDYNIDEYNSSVGGIVTTDKEGIEGLRSTTIGLQYAYQVRLNYKWTFRPAIQASYTFRDVNFDNLTFGDQFGPDGLVRPVSLENLSPGVNVRYFDLGFGGIVFNDRIWLGASAFNLLEPDQSFFGTGESVLPRRLSLHGGYKFDLPVGPFRRGKTEAGQERSISPTFNFKRQGVYDQLDLGVYLTLEPLITGLWYRGIPVKQFNGFANNESLIGMVGLMHNSFTFGYSFDYTLSRLGIGSGGAHEISIIYSFSWADPRKPPRNVRELSCPIPFIF